MIGSIEKINHNSHELEARNNLMENEIKRVKGTTVPFNLSNVSERTADLMVESQLRGVWDSYVDNGMFLVNQDYLGAEKDGMASVLPNVNIELPTGMNSKERNLLKIEAQKAVNTLTNLHFLAGIYKNSKSANFTLLERELGISNKDQVQGKIEELNESISIQTHDLAMKLLGKESKKSGTKVEEKTPRKSIIAPVGRMNESFERSVWQLAGKLEEDYVGISTEKKAVVLGMMSVGMVALSGCTDGGVSTEVLNPTQITSEVEIEVIKPNPTEMSVEKTPTSFVEQGPESTQEPVQETVSYDATDLSVEMVSEVLGAGGDYPLGFYVENNDGEMVPNEDIQAVVDKVQALMDQAGSGFKAEVRTNGKIGDDFRWAVVAVDGDKNLAGWLMIKNESGNWILAERPDLQSGLDPSVNEFMYGLPEKLNPNNIYQTIQIGSEDWFLIETDVEGNPLRVWDRVSQEMIMLQGATYETIKVPENYVEFAVPDRYVVEVVNGKVEKVLESGLVVYIDPETGEYKLEKKSNGEVVVYEPRTFFLGGEPNDKYSVIESGDLPSEIIESAKEMVLNVDESELFIRDGESVPLGYDEVWGIQDWGNNKQMWFFGVNLGVGEYNYPKENIRGSMVYMGTMSMSGDIYVVGLPFPVNSSDSDMSQVVWSCMGGEIPERIQNEEHVNIILGEFVNVMASERAVGEVMHLRSKVYSELEWELEWNRILEEFVLLMSVDNEVQISEGKVNIRLGNISLKDGFWSEFGY